MHTKKWFLPVVALAVVVVVAVAVFLLKPASKPAAKFQADGNVITQEMTKADLEAQQKAAQEEADRKRFVMEYQRPIHFKGKEGMGYIVNAAENIYAMYFVVTVDGEEIIHTGLVPIGGKIEKFELLKELAPGNYDGVLTYNSVDEAKQEEIAQSMPVAVDITIEAA